MSRAVLTYMPGRPVPWAKLATGALYAAALALVVVVASAAAILAGGLLFRVLPDRPAAVVTVALATSFGIAIGFWLASLGRAS